VLVGELISEKIYGEIVVLIHDFEMHV